MPEVEGAYVSGLGEIPAGPRIEAAVHGGEHSPDGAVAAAEILRSAHDGEVRPWLEGRITGTRCAFSHGVEYADRRSVREPTQELRGAEDRRRLQWNGIAIDAGQLGRPADASTIVERFAVAVDGAAVHVEAEQPASGDEEWAPLVEERLVRIKVEDRGVGLHLPEIRVDRRVERQVRSHAIFHVAADRHVRFLSVGVVGDLRRALRDDIGQRLESARRLQVVHAVEDAELRHQVGLRLAEHGPTHPLTVPIDVAIDREAKGVLAVPAIAHLR